MAPPDPKKPLVIIGAGGTGGHMFPAAAFAEEMASRGWDVGLMSDVRGLRYGAKFPADWKTEVKAASPNLRKPWTLPGTLLKLLQGSSEASRIIKARRPNLVAGFGGYPAFPLMRAGHLAGIPILIHEQNAVLGRVNRQFAKSAKTVASGFERLDRCPAGVTHQPVGNPVRSAIANVRGTPFPGMDHQLRIFITGGSQGARILGSAVPEAIINHLPESLRTRLHVVQQVREEQIDEVCQIYADAGVSADLRSFFDDMPDQLAAAHYVIARSGAGTVSELGAVGRPSLLVPLAIAMDDHQTANAEGIAKRGAADVLPETEFTPDRIGKLLSERLGAPEDLAKRAAAAHACGQIDAAQRLADIAVSIALPH